MAKTSVNQISARSLARNRGRIPFQSLPFGNPYITVFASSNTRRHLTALQDIIHRDPCLGPMSECKKRSNRGQGKLALPQDDRLGVLFLKRKAGAVEVVPSLVDLVRLECGI